MIIDAHTHTFPEKIAARAIGKLSHDANIRAFTDGTMEQLRQSSQGAGVDWSIVLPVATDPSQVVRINDSSAQINEQLHENGIFSLGCMHPDFPDYKTELRRIKRIGLTGIKLHPFFQDTCFDDIRYLRILSEAAALGLIVVTHAGLDVGYPGVVRVSPQMCLQAVTQIGPFPLVLAHMGGWGCWEEVADVLPGTGVYLDTAFCSTPLAVLHRKNPDDPTASGTEDAAIRPDAAMLPDAPMLPDALFMRLCNAFGADHILFGSDSPWADQKEALSHIRSLPLSEEHRDMILGKNAARLFSLEAAAC